MIEKEEEIIVKRCWMCGEPLKVSLKRVREEFKGVIDGGVRNILYREKGWIARGREMSCGVECERKRIEGRSRPKGKT